MSSAPLPTTVVVPTVGRPSLGVLLDALERSAAVATGPERVLLVDDRPAAVASADPLAAGHRALPVAVLRSGGRGPAAARNVGLRTATTPWVSFLDDDVVPDDDWFARLAADLAAARPRTAGVQGRVRVPLPPDRRPTDWERGTAGLAESRWITADMSYRRAELRAVGGFDERFRRAFREDADLALRLLAAGCDLDVGRRWITHPVRPVDDDWVSVRLQRGNSDDVLMRRLHGPSWYDRAEAARGRISGHLATTGAAAVAVGAAAVGRWRLAALAAAVWAGSTAEFAWARIAPGPRDAAEVRRMLVTSALIPPAATWYAVTGWLRHRRAQPWVGLPELVLFDRDGTLVVDVPYNDDPERVQPLPGAAEAVAALRSRGIKVGIVSNQSGVARGRLTLAQAGAVTDRVVELLGPFDGVEMCPHEPADGCTCRKPAPGLVLAACAEAGVSPERCVVVGDIGSDVAAALAAGARGVLVPNAATAPEEVRAATWVAPDLATVVRQLVDLEGPHGPARGAFAARGQG